MNKILAFLSVAAIFSACIGNDIPFPTVNAEITELDVEGAKEVSINADRRTVTVSLEEAVDMRKVNIRAISWSPEEAQLSWDIRGVRDLTKPLKVTLSTYQDYQWTITAKQSVEIRLRLKGQLGDAIIDRANRRVLTKVPSGSELTKLEIEDIKLGPEGITSYFPDPSQIHDFTDGAAIEVRYHDKSEKWTIYAELSESSVELVSVNPWTCIAYFEGRGIAGNKAGFRIRKEGGEWTEISAEVAKDGRFSASADGLEPHGVYEVTAFCGDDQTAAVSFSTDDAVQLPNSGFEAFSNAESQKYYSFYDPASDNPELRSKFWDDGNSGSTTIGSKYAITMPDLEDKVEGRSSAKLKSEYVIIKFAAGNIFTGQYWKTVGTSGGIVRLGRPFTHRPRKLVLQMKYRCGVITEKTMGGKPAGDPVKVGDTDRGTVYVALGDWDYRKFGGSPETPVEINTTDESTFFNPESEAVIAYGQHIATEPTDGWIKVEIPLEYRSLTRKPTHIIVLGAASMLGDYFTGSADSVLWLDDLKLEY